MARKTTLEVVDEDLWAWAQYRAKLLRKKTSEYLFDLMAEDKSKKEKAP